MREMSLLWRGVTLKDYKLFIDNWILKEKRKRGKRRKRHKYLTL